MDLNLFTKIIYIVWAGAASVLRWMHLKRILLQMTCCSWTIQQAIRNSGITICDYRLLQLTSGQTQALLQTFLAGLFLLAMHPMQGYQNGCQKVCRRYCHLKSPL